MIKLIIFFNNYEKHTHYSGYLFTQHGCYVTVVGIPIRLYNIPNENS